MTHQESLDKEKIQKLEREVERLKDVLYKYCDCRHACLDCFCTKEARAAMWNYLRPR